MSKFIVPSYSIRDDEWSFEVESNKNDFPSYCLCFASLEDTQREVDNFIQSQNVPYIVGSKGKGFGTTDVKAVIKEKSKRLQWKSKAVEFNKMPFVIIGRKFMYCHQGRDQNRYKKRKRLLRNINKEDETQYRYRASKEASKKVGCPASIEMFHIAQFSNFQALDDNAEADKRKVASSIRSMVENDDFEKLEIQEKFYVLFPSSDAHVGHTVSKTGRTADKVNDRRRQEAVSNCEEKMEKLKRLIAVVDVDAIEKLDSKLLDLTKELESSQQVIHLQICTSPLHEENHLTTEILLQN